MLRFESERRIKKEGRTSVTSAALTSCSHVLRPREKRKGYISLNVSHSNTQAPEIESADS